jgi:hypothetical protein
MGKEKKAKVGRPKNIESADKMQQYFRAYIEFTKQRPFLVNDFVGKDATEVIRQKERPLTMEGFEDWLDIHGIITDVSDYFENKEGRYKEFVPVCRAIKRKIRKDQIEGGMAGIYNPSITQRLNNLSEQTKQEQSGTLNVIYSRADSTK